MLEDVNIEPGSIDGKRIAKVTLGCGDDSCDLVVVAPSEMQMFKRNAFKAIGTPSATQKQWLVVREGSLSIYIKPEGEIIISREDLYP